VDIPDQRAGQPRRGCGRAPLIAKRVPEFNGGTASRPRAPGDVAAWTDMRVCGRGRRQGECSLNDVPRRCGRAGLRAAKFRRCDEPPKPCGVGVNIGLRRKSAGIVLPYGRMRQRRKIRLARCVQASKVAQVGLPTLSILASNIEPRPLVATLTNQTARFPTKQVQPRTAVLPYRQHGRAI